MTGTGVVLLLAGGLAVAAFLPGGPRPALLILAGAVLAAGLLMVLLAARVERGSRLSGPRVLRYPGIVGILRGPRAQASAWALLPEADSVRAVRQWMMALMDFPRSRRVEVLELAVLGVYHLSAADRTRVIQVRGRALGTLPPRRQGNLIGLHREMLSRLPARVRWQEEEVLAVAAAAIAGRLE